MFRDLDRNGGNWNAMIPGESRGNGSRAGFHWEEAKHEILQNEDAFYM